MTKSFPDQHWVDVEVWLQAEVVQAEHVSEK